jgi:hypothetical protein
MSPDSTDVHDELDYLDDLAVRTIQQFARDDQSARLILVRAFIEVHDRAGKRILNEVDRRFGAPRKDV